MEDRAQGKRERIEQRGRTLLRNANESSRQRRAQSPARHQRQRRRIQSPQRGEATALAPHDGQQSGPISLHQQHQHDIFSLPSYNSGGHLHLPGQQQQQQNLNHQQMVNPVGSGVALPMSRSFSNEHASERPSQKPARIAQQLPRAQHQQEQIQQRQIGSPQRGEKQRGAEMDEAVVVTHDQQLLIQQHHWPHQQLLQQQLNAMPNNDGQRNLGHVMSERESYRGTQNRNETDD